MTDYKSIVKRTPPVPRDKIFKLYWYFASERHSIFRARVSGKKSPWTQDPIFRTYKFCNVFRAADRVSQYMIQDVAYAADAGSSLDRLFQILAFRVFSNTGTWETLKRYLAGPPKLKHLQDGSFARALELTKAERGTIYTGAFILCANNAFKRDSKHENHLELFKYMFIKNRLGDDLLTARSLEEVFNLLHDFPLMGDFMSYQIAIDLNYSELINFSENDFTKPGPGALRGIKKVFESLGDYSPAEAILWMVDAQVEAFRELGLPFEGLWGRDLHAIDCQGLFCEVDKYCREAAPDLASARKRIKAKFSESTVPIKLFFPPKWGINNKLPKKPVFGYESSIRLL